MVSYHLLPSVLANQVNFLNAPIARKSLGIVSVALTSMKKIVKKNHCQGGYLLFYPKVFSLICQNYSDK